MIKTILTTATIVLATAPAFANTSTFSSVGYSSPALTLYVSNITSNISCRSKTRSKYFELGARDMSRDDSNTQWGTIGTMQALVWCRDTQAIIAVAGSNQSSAIELRDEIVKAF